MTERIINKHNIRLIVIFFAISFSCNIQSQTNTVAKDVIGYWDKTESLEKSLPKLQSKWIWLAKDDDSKMMLARRTFNLKKDFESAILRLTATSKYELFINGEYVLQGPARSAPHHQSYDILDLSKVLKEGDNLIALKVHFQQGRTSYHEKTRAGLMLQLDLTYPTANEKIISDEKFKVLADNSWNNEEVKMNRFQQLVNDRIDFSKKEADWNSSNYDDSKWANANVLRRNQGWPAPQRNEESTHQINPWMGFVARDIPYLIEEEVKGVKLIKASRIPVSQSDNIALDNKVDKKVLRSFNKGNDVKLNSSDGEKYCLILDLGEGLNAIPEIVFDGEKASKVEVLYAPFVLNNTFTCKIVASKYKDEILLSGNEDKWRSTYFKSARYIAILVEGNTTIKDMKIKSLKYPFNAPSNIKISGDDKLEKLWDASIKTIYTCTSDAFTDNYRERRQYAQTGYYAALGNYFTLGDFDLQRRYLIQVAQEQEANGIMPAYAPLATGDFMIIMDSNCLYIRSLYNYLLYSGDYKTVKELLPAAEKLLSLLDSYTNELGLIDSPPYSYWLDHAKNDRRGANFNLNGHYLGALEDYAKLLEFLHLDSKKYQERSAVLRTSLAKYFWNDDKGLYVDALVNGEQSTEYSEHANAMALALKIADEKRGKIVAETLLENDNNNFITRENGMTMVTPAMSYFLHKGLAEYGYVDQSFDLLYDKFSMMLEDDSNGTLWEEWWLDGTGRTGKFVGGRTRSDAQTESVFTPALVVEYLFGLEVTSPGMEEFKLKIPNTNKLKIESNLPTPNGKLYLKWDLSNSILELKIPANTKIKLDSSSFEKDYTISKKINKKYSKVDIEQALAEGEYQIKF